MYFFLFLFLFFILSKEKSNDVSEITHGRPLSKKLLIEQSTQSEKQKELFLRDQIKYHNFLNFHEELR